jgi:hypothetical protein
LNGGNILRRYMQLIALILTLILAYGADSVLEAAKTRASHTFIQTPVLWLNTVILLVFATVMLGLAWFALVRQPMSKAVSWAYLVIGCLVLFIFPIQMTSGIILLPAGISVLTWNSFLGRAGAFAAMIGIIDLIRKK